MRLPALAYAARGMPIFPIKPRHKAPMTAHGVKDATSDQEQVATWWTQWPEANIGLACGDPSGYYVIDLDGPEGAASWRALETQHGEAPTLTAKTGSGGLHLYYELPHGVKLGNSAKKIAPGVDSRGTGGYVLMPPSVTDRGSYQWLGGKSQLLPGFIVAALQYAPLERAESRRLAVKARAEEDNALGLRILDEECAAIMQTPEGGRNNELFVRAIKVLELTWGGEIRPVTAFTALRDAGIAVGLDKHEVEATIESANRHAREQPRRIRTRLEA